VAAAAAGAGKTGSRRDGIQPMVSVIIPAYNEEVGLVATLKTTFDADCAVHKDCVRQLVAAFADPMTYLDDVVMVGRAVLTLLLYIYSLEIVNYGFLYVLMAMTSFVYLLVFLSDNHERTIKNMIILPLVYFLSHLSMVIEVYALLTAYWTMITRRQVGWQKLQRRGVVDS
jgi:hypothetical protein